MSRLDFDRRRRSHKLAAIRSTHRMHSSASFQAFGLALGTYTTASLDFISGTRVTHRYPAHLKNGGPAPI